MAITAANKKTKVTPEEAPKKGTSFFDYLRFGESYTSLILGIIVVIIATALLLSFVHSKNAGNKNIPIDQQTRNTTEISQQALELTNKAPNSINDKTVSIAPTSTIVPTSVPTATPKPTEAPKPTAKSQPTSKTIPTIKPTIVAKAIPPITPQSVKKVTIVPQKKTKVAQVKNNKGKTVWVVKKDESLWIIAQKNYTSGDKWVEIARINNLSNPSDIHVGDRLILPNIKTVNPTTVATVKNNSSIKHVQTKPMLNSASMSKISGHSYTVVKGDNLWNIALRAYGDGFRWGDIAKANNLANPRMIFSGNVLQIPR